MSNACRLDMFLELSQALACMTASGPLAFSVDFRVHIMKRRIDPQVTERRYLQTDVPSDELCFR